MDKNFLFWSPGEGYLRRNFDCCPVHQNSSVILIYLESPKLLLFLPSLEKCLSVSFNDCTFLLTFTTDFNPKLNYGKSNRLIW